MMQPGGSEIDQHVEMTQPGDNLENSGEPVAPLLIITYSDDIPLLFDQNGCVICLNQFAELEQIVMVSACSHAFHFECMEAYLVKRSGIKI
jgi:hypothetical protein